MTGSWFLIREESLEKARERLSKDVYVLGGAWDLSKVRSLAHRRTLKCRIELILSFAGHLHCRRYCQALEYED